jgi:hypothetical protein
VNNCSGTRIYRHQGHYYVMSKWGPVELGATLRWALYRYVCVMDGAPLGIAHRALIASDQRVTSRPHRLEAQR